MTHENVRIPEVGTGIPENRWAAFTDDELITMEGAIREAMLLIGVARESIDLLKPIVGEMRAEHERRKT